MKFKTKLYLGFGIKLLLIVILTFSMIVMLNKLNQTTIEIVKNRYEYVKLSTKIRNNLSYIDRSLNNIVLTNDQFAINENIQLIYKYREDTIHKLATLEDKIVIDEIKAAFLKLVAYHNDYINIENQVIELVNNGNKEQATEIMLTKALETRTKLITTIEWLNLAQEKLMDKAMKDSSTTYHNSIQLGIVITVLTLLIGIITTIWVIRSITKSLRNIIQVLQSVDTTNTNNLPRIEVNSHDEIGEISRSFNKMAVALEEHSRHEENLKQKMVIQNWIDSKIAEITGMYPRIQSLKNMASDFITKICPLIGATYGVFYVKEKINGQEQLRKIASYAGEGDVQSKNVFQLGEGLIGQCALEMESLLIKDVPEGYIKIASGLGDSKPANLYIVPIKFEGEVIGVLEFASFKTFEEHYIILVERVIRGLGISMNNIWRNMEIQRLLEESQTLTEELQSQSEELQLQQEELKSINEKLEDQYKSSEMKTKELEKTKLELEEKANQLEISSQYKSQFLANISHELRTPLNSLLILAQILFENEEQNLTPKQVHYAKTIYSSGNDLLNLINDILDLTKIESGKVRTYIEEVYLTEIVEFVKDQFNPVAQKNQLDFIINIADNLPSSINTDKQHLQQILKNLLSNAFKFTKKGSVELVIEKGKGYDKARLQCSSEECVLSISVKDTGIGISKEKQSIIFEAFEQADGTTSRNYGGTGLGLSISKELAHLLGGYIKVESVEGEGSTFTFFLPVLSKECEIIQSEIAASIQCESETQQNNKNKSIHQKLDMNQEEELLRNKKVLIVDDDMRNVFALTTILENKSINVEFAENGKEGIRKLEEKRDFDLILMDIMMPEMDGFEAMRQIRSIPEFEKVPIIAITAKAMKQDKEKCIEAGASDYISKPINVEKLFSLMKVWLSR